MPPGRHSAVPGTLVGMDVPGHSRNHTARPGFQERDAVDLLGWDEQSIWGWDEGLSSFYAQLWRNGSVADSPEIWLSGTRTSYPWPGCLALDIVKYTGVDPLTIVRAMAIAHPAPTVRTDEEILRVLAKLRGGDAYIGGHIQALAWTQGLSN